MLRIRYPNRFFHAMVAVAFLLMVAMSFGPARAESRIFIPTGDAGGVLVLDTRTDTIVEGYDGVAAAHGLAATPDGRLLIVGSYSERPADGTLPEKPDQMSASDHAAHHGGGDGPKGIDGAVSIVTVMEARSGAIVRRIEVPGAVHHVAIDRAGLTALVTHPGQDSVTAINLATFEVIASLRTGTTPNYAVFGADGRAYVSNTGDDTISVLDTKRWRVLDAIGTGTGPEHLAIDARGTQLWVNATGSDTVDLVDLDRNEVSGSIKLGGMAHGVDVSAGGGMVYVAVNSEDKVIALSKTKRAVVAERNLTGPYHLTFAQSTNRIYVSSNVRPVIWVLDPRDLTVLKEIDLPGTGHQMVEVQ